MNARKLIKKTDIIIICVIIAAALCALLARRDTPASLRCNVFFNGKCVKTIRLDKDSIFKIGEAPGMEFEVRDSRIAAVHSDCPDKICVKSGFIKHAGQKIVCLPNRVVVSIDAASGGLDEPDAVAR